MATLSLSDLRQRVGNALPPAVADELHRWRFQFREEAHLIKRYADPTRAAIDVGANRGAVTRLLAQTCRHVYAYEPDRDSRESLLRRKPPNVTVYPYACSDEAGHMELLHLQPGAVEAVRLDEMGHSVHDIGFIKIGVQGHELAAVRGAANLLAVARPTLWLEMNGHSYEGGMAAGVAAIEALGYRGFFNVAGREYPATLFSDKVFQPVQPDTRAHLPGYINTFVFIPL